MKTKTQKGGLLKTLELIAPTPRYVGIFDFLGFKSMVENNKLLEIVNIVQPLVAETISYASARLSQVEKEWNLDSGSLSMKNPIWFSDTIIYYSESLLPLILVAQEFIAQSLCAGLPVRGAISLGDFYVPADDENRLRETFVGKALIQSYKLEQKQEWAGAVIDPNVYSQIKPQMLYALKELRVIAYYDVPTKLGLFKYHCVDWRQRFSELSPCTPLSIEHLTKWTKMNLNNTDEKTLKNINKLRNSINFYQLRNEVT